MAIPGERITSSGSVGRICHDFTCQSDDIFYPGSEDEDYDHPDTRLRRCEDAAQRYLSGHAPLLISAALRGPFDRESGWLNPWRSKDRTSSSSSARPAPSDPSSVSVPGPVPTERASSPPQRAAGSATPVATGGPNSSCHLPSPQSLKQAPLSTESPPFLMQGELVTMQECRSNTRSPSSENTSTDAHDPTPTPAQITEAFGKRRRDEPPSVESDDADRGKRLKATVRPSQEAPMAKAGRPMPFDPVRDSVERAKDMEDGNADGSLESPPELSRPDAEPIEGQGNNGLRASPPPATLLERLSALQSGQMPRADSRASSTSRAGLPSSTNNNERPSPAQQAAAASLSSPHSQRDESPPASLRQGTPKEVKSISQLLNGTGATMEESPVLHSEVEVGTNGLDTADIDVTDTQGSPSIEGTADPETQRDQSFAFKLIRSRRTRHGKKSRNSQTQGPSQDVPSNGDPGTSLFSEDDQIKTELVETGPQDSPMFKAPAIPADAETRLHESPVDGAASQQQAEAEADSRREARATGSLQRPSTPTMIMKREPESCPNTPLLLTQQLSSSPRGSGLQLEPPQQTSQLVELAGGGGSVLGSQVVVDADPPDSSQGKTFSIRSILNCCVTPLRRLSGLALSSEPSSSQRGEPGPSESHAQRAESPSLVAMKGRRTDEEQPQPTPTGEGADAGPSTDSFVLAMESTAMSQSQALENETPSRVPSYSQQSPWIQAQSSKAARAAQDTSTGRGADALKREQPDPLTTPIPAEAQSPWIPQAQASAASGGLGTAADTTSSQSRTEKRVETMQTPCGPGEGSKRPRLDGLEATSPRPRPSTPEPHFSTPSFSSFLTPSPIRRSRQAKQQQQSLKSVGYQTILASVMKNPWKSARPGRRVSWAPLPQDVESPCAMRHLLNPETKPLPSAPPCKTTRPSSPPPLTPLSQISISEDTKFQGHFAAVSNRSDIFRLSTTTTSHAETPSPEPETVKVKSEPSPSDDIDITATSPSKVPTTKEKEKEKEKESGEDIAPSEVKAGLDSDDGQDPMDLVEDIFNELGDFLQTFDVDAELDQARKAAKKSDASRSQTTQSPW